MATATDVPEHLVCPITQALFVDPVCDKDGVSYERAAIMQWLLASNQQTSPMTRKPLAAADLVPNRALKDAADKYRADHGIAAPAPAHAQAAVAAAATATTTAAGATAATAAAPATGAAGGIGVKVYRHPTSAGDYIATLTTPDAPVDGIEVGRFGADVVCVVDVSGSMGSDAPVQAADGAAPESTGLNVLQVVSHAVRTVAAMLSPGDRLSVVTFSNGATTLLPLTAMDAAGKAAVDRALRAAEPFGRTNLWAGLQTAIETIAHAPPPPLPAPSLRATAGAPAPTAPLARHRVKQVLLLTDGEPTEHPPRGYLPTLRSLLDRTAGAGGVTMHTFAFGMDAIQHVLLDELAEAMHGSFTFIPDAGLVGTCFVNVISSILAAAATSVVVTIGGNGGSGGGGAPARVTCPDVQFGGEQPLWISTTAVAATSGSGGAKSAAPVPTSTTAGAAAAAAAVAADHALVTFVTPAAGFVAVDVPIASSAEIPPALLQRMQLRRCFVDAVRAAGRAQPTEREQHQKHVAAILDAIKPVAAAGADGDGDATAALARGMQRDLESQVLLGLSRDDYFKKWLRPYALSLARANELRITNNFKDRSVAYYATPVFERLQQAGEAAFLALPPPVPIVRAAPATTLTRQGATAHAVTHTMPNANRPAAAPVVVRRAVTRAKAASSSDSDSGSAGGVMQSYYDVGGGCVSGDSLVAVVLPNSAGVAHKPARDVRRGDELVGGGVVDCTVAIALAAPVKLVTFRSAASAQDGELKITAWHPVRVGGGRLAFPADCVDGAGVTMAEVEPEELVDRAVYTFVLRATAAAADNGEAHATAIADGMFVRVGGVDVLSWGHGVVDAAVDPVAAHDFFGSRAAVVAALRDVDKRGYDELGRVRVGGLLRDARSHKVVGLRA